MEGLYAIIDTDACAAAGVGPVHLAGQVLDGGCAVLQLRAKTLSDEDYLQLARTLVPLCHARGVPFIVNDRAHLVEPSGADGVHLGQGDMATSSARKLVGSRLVGRSTHDPFQAQKAIDEGVDWLAFGPIFPTVTKADAAPVVGLAALASICDLALPKGIAVIGIGGIHRDRVASVRRAGAALVAVISALAASAEPRAAAAELHRLCRSPVLRE